MEVDEPVAYDEVDMTRLRAEKLEIDVEMVTEQPPIREPATLRLYHMMSPVQKLQVLLMTVLAAVTILAQVLGILGQATTNCGLRYNTTENK